MSENSITSRVLAIHSCYNFSPKTYVTHTLKNIPYANSSPRKNFEFVFRESISSCAFWRPIRLYQLALYCHREIARVIVIRRWRKMRCSVAREWRGRKFRVDRTHLPLMDSQWPLRGGKREARTVPKKSQNRYTINGERNSRSHPPSAFTDVYVRARTSHSMQIRFDSCRVVYRTPKTVPGVLCRRQRASEREGRSLIRLLPSTAKFVERVTRHDALCAERNA